MSAGSKKLDMILLVVLVVIVVSIPLGIDAYNHHLWAEKIPVGAKEFTLTGHAQKGWLLGEVHAYDAISFWENTGPAKQPVIVVHKGDLVVLKLRSSDVVHGFSLKDFGIFVNDGIQPGKTLVVSFVADKAGTFKFSCNAICGHNHENMQGTLVVEA